MGWGPGKSWDGDLVRVGGGGPGKCLAIDGVGIGRVVIVSYMYACLQSVSKLATTDGVLEQESQEWDLTDPPHEGNISTDSLSDHESSQNVSFPEVDEGGGEGAASCGDMSEVTPPAGDPEHTTFVFSDGEDSAKEVPGRGGVVQPEPGTGDPDDVTMQGGDPSNGGGGGGGLEGVPSLSTQGSLKPWKIHSIQQFMSASSLTAAKKMPRFKWSRFNLRLLEDLLQSLQLCIAKWNR